MGRAAGAGAGVVQAARLRPVRRDQRPGSIRIGEPGGVRTISGAFASSATASSSAAGLKPVPWTGPIAVIEDVVTSSVCPSGALCATAATPTALPAPGRFSTTKGWPKRACSRSASGRAMASFDPPGVKGTTMRTGRAGQPSAWAMHRLGKGRRGQAGAPAAASRARRPGRCGIGFPPPRCCPSPRTRRHLRIAARSVPCPPAGADMAEGVGRSRSSASLACGQRWRPGRGGRGRAGRRRLRRGGRGGRDRGADPGGAGLGRGGDRLRPR